MPEKSQLQYNYILFPYGSACPPSALSAKPAANEPTAAAAPEPLVLTVAASGAAAAPKAGSVGGTLAAQAAARAGDGYTTLFDWALTAHLNAGGSPAREITRADPSRFKSAVRQPHRPNEPAVHVKAFRGSKDGYLFFLDTGLLWGFKKPLLFVPLDRVAAVSYTSVLQRTFNMIVEVYAGGAGTGAEGGEKTEEVEFAMLDQEDYSAIDQSWVRRHGLQDRSMAEQRRAKRQLAENAADGAGAAGSRAANGGGGAAAAAAAGDYGEGEAEEGDEFAGMTELEKAHAIAERQLQDAEDEEEEDYDPGSEGYSDGSGSSGEEQEDDQGEGGYEEEVGEDEDEEEREDEQ